MVQRGYRNCSDSGASLELEPTQAAVLGEVCAGPLISVEELKAAGALEAAVPQRRRRVQEGEPQLFDMVSA